MKKCDRCGYKGYFFGLLCTKCFLKGMEKHLVLDVDLGPVEPMIGIFAQPICEMCKGPLTAETHSVVADLCRACYKKITFGEKYKVIDSPSFPKTLFGKPIEDFKFFEYDDTLHQTQSQWDTQFIETKESMMEKLLKMHEELKPKPYHERPLQPDIGWSRQLVERLDYHFGDTDPRISNHSE